MSFVIPSRLRVSALVATWSVRSDIGRQVLESLKKRMKVSRSHGSVICFLAIKERTHISRKTRPFGYSIGILQGVPD